VTNRVRAGCSLEHTGGAKRPHATAVTPGIAGRVGRPSVSWRRHVGQSSGDSRRTARNFRGYSAAVAFGCLFRLHERSQLTRAAAVRPDLAIVRSIGKKKPRRPEGAAGLRAKVAGGFISRLDSWGGVCGGSRAAKLQFCRNHANCWATGPTGADPSGSRASPERPAIGMRKGREAHGARLRPLAKSTAVERRRQSAQPSRPPSSF
jgi:hypothetical protein